MHWGVHRQNRQRHVPMIHHHPEQAQHHWQWASAAQHIQQTIYSKWSTNRAPHLLCNSIRATEFESIESPILPHVNHVVHARLSSPLPSSPSSPQQLQHKRSRIPSYPILSPYRTEASRKRELGDTISFRQRHDFLQHFVFDLSAWRTCRGALALSRIPQSTLS